MTHASLTVLIALAGCMPACESPPPSDRSPASATPATPTVLTPPPLDAVRSFARSSNAFGFDLYARLRTAPGNVVVSPASLTTALAMAWGGARGPTAAEMKQVLHLDGTPGEVMATSGALARWLEDPGRPIVFRIANQLFGERSIAFEGAFLEETAAAHGAPLELVDFKTAPLAARSRINAWVESETEHRITELLPADGVDADTRLVLVNASSFAAKWAQPFPHERTRPRPFHTTRSTHKEVPTMQTAASFGFARGDGLSVLELPYAGGMSMLIVVPDALDGLAAVEQSLDADRLDELARALKPTFVSVQLPKFELAPDRSTLGEALQALGMRTAFDRARADFTGIASPPAPDERLVLGELFHKAVVRVDERGTEADAATAVSMPKAGVPMELAVDRPFLFFIRDTASGLIVFAGRVADPSQR